MMNPYRTGKKGAYDLIFDDWNDTSMIVKRAGGLEVRVTNIPLTSVTWFDEYAGSECCC